MHMLPGASFFMISVYLASAHELCCSGGSPWFEKLGFVQAAGDRSSPSPLCFYRSREGQPLWDKPGGQGDTIQDHIQAEGNHQIKTACLVLYAFIPLCGSVIFPFFARAVFYHKLAPLNTYSLFWNPECKLGATSVSHVMKILYGVGVSPCSNVRFMHLLKTGHNIQMSEMRVWQNYKDLCLEDPTQIQKCFSSVNISNRSFTERGTDCRLSVWMFLNLVPMNLLLIVMLSLN